MHKQAIMLSLLLAGLLSGAGFPAFSDNASVSCYSPLAIIPANGTGTAYVDCDIYINGDGTDNNYYIAGNTHNFLMPATLTLQSLTHQLTAVRQASVTSPNNTVTAIAGTAAGFTGIIPNPYVPGKLQFQYAITNTAETAPGLYSSYFSPGSYQYQLCSSANCDHHVLTGTASMFLSALVQSTPLSVSCASPTVNATPGGGTFTMDVTCTISGSNASRISPDSQNIFSPASITVTQGASTIPVTLQPIVTSPDNSVSAISGTASGGFSGTINTLPAQVRVQYQGSTSATTTAGAYTSAPVTFTWSTL